MFSDPKTLLFALVTGVIPSLLWLWFWLKEDKRHPEPKALLTAIFVMGMLSVIVVLPVQKFIRANVASPSFELFLWATAEEIIKYLAVVILVHRTYQAEEPIDWPIYLITAALGFAALENTLFLREPFALQQTAVGLLTGHLRFLGSTLLHTVASAAVGIGIGLSFHLGPFRKKMYLLSGLAIAIVLHTIFNFFIIRNGGADFLKVFGFLWVTAVVIMLVFEKLRRMV
jgi:protease PrsW